VNATVVNPGVVNAAGESLDAVLAKTPCLWRGRQANHWQATLPTGHARLDRRLPGGGWPQGAVTEFMAAHPGLGEFSLLFPALARVGDQGRWLSLIDPPWIPYPATLHGHGLCLEHLLLIKTAGQDESLWACEQALRGMPEGIVLSWPKDIRFAALRRLQLAAESQGATAFLFRPASATTLASPAALRLQLDSAGDATRIRILKCRGHASTRPLVLRQPQCKRDGSYERSTMAGDMVAATGPGLPHPRASQASRPLRHH